MYVPPFLPHVRFVDICVLDIDAEVRYAVRNEYAQHATDVLARRTRLSVLSVQASLRALPRVVDIMGEELGWSRSRKWREIQDTVRFLESMGLAPGSIVSLPEPPPRGPIEKVRSVLWRAFSGAWYAPNNVRLLSRARFEAGEVATLKNVFEKWATKTDADDEEQKVFTKDVLEMLKEVPVSGYQEITKKTFEYVLVEGGFKGRGQVDFHEFLEVGALLELMHDADFRADMWKSEGRCV